MMITSRSCVSEDLKNDFIDSKIFDAQNPEEA